MKRKRTLEQEAARAMRKQLKAFRKKFGRDPGPGDPVFFDPKKDVPTPMDEAEMEKMLLDALQKSGAPPEVIYAHKKTGRIGMRGAMDNWPEDARREWEDAIDEYFRLEDDAEKTKKS
jgi:hypothetical protein